LHDSRAITMKIYKAMEAREKNTESFDRRVVGLLYVRRVRMSLLTRGDL
jgi:hypothetical protein